MCGCFDPSVLRPRRDRDGNRPGDPESGEAPSGDSGVEAAQTGAAPASASSSVARRAIKPA